MHFHRNQRERLCLRVLPLELVNKGVEFEIMLPAILGARESAGAPSGDVFRPIAGRSWTG